MIKSLRLELSFNEFEIIYGDSFSVSSDTLDHLVYEKDNVWHVKSDPCRGRLGKTVITLPHGCEFDDVRILINDATLTIGSLDCTKFMIDTNNSTVDISGITTNYLYIKSTRGTMRLMADADITEIDCGYGEIDLRLKPYKYGYKIKSTCGIGEVCHNSMLLPKKFASPSGERRVDIICGMGKVDFYT